ncbi:uncharacterized protein GGS22DRAFT_92601 [Annulohypoxylon maeteangense]|uniref:uncharacterized protein n=1 Tax=Annulohypoxylon maeteangense TaxID=1927788 RepID=UPI002007DBAF|nr:uncharacterized protein GGS22DRAFT_92601 [Annulohypoxylon maeteangense]KAI0888033.1 hypothetical protein GGS22DRAFT_92601 [Annulohypoxylon maeteangense]
MSGYTTLRTALRARSTHLPSTPGRLAAIRQIHPSSALRAPYKDDMDRESFKPKSHEYTQSGTDEEVATKQDAAFNPNKTDPETEKNAAAEESNGNPLEQSPANKSFAEAGKGKEEDKSHGGRKKKASGGGGAPKNSKVS